MSKKTMLITGASRGIGKAFHDSFKEQYHIITAHRSQGADFQGDLTDIEFQNKLISNITPDVFINNAGGLTGDPYQTLSLNGYSACKLLLGFHEKMPLGVIINISSIAAHEQGWLDIDYDEVAYTGAKRMLSTISSLLQKQKNKPVKVSCLELGPVYTEAFADRIKPLYPEEKDWTNQDQTPIDLKEVIESVKFILSQPVWTNTTTLRLDTNSRHYGN